MRTAGITVKLPPLARLDHGKHVKGLCQQNVLNFAKTSYLEFTFFSYNYIKSIKTLSLREKINYLGFSPKFYRDIIAFQGFQIRKFFCDISFRLQDIVKILVFRFFLTVHIFKFLIMPFLQCLKSSSSGIQICLNFFHILHH